jgi:hypothetical protein
MGSATVERVYPVISGNMPLRIKNDGKSVCLQLEIQKIETLKDRKGSK